MNVLEYKFDVDLRSKFSFGVSFYPFPIFFSKVQFQCLKQRWKHEWMQSIFYLGMCCSSSNNLIFCNNCSTTCNIFCLKLCNKITEKKMENVNKISIF